MTTSKRMMPLAVVIFGLLFAMLLAPGWARAQDDCEAKLSKAEEEFANTRFDEAIALLTGCLDKNAFSNPERQRAAYRLLGLSYLGKDYIEQAKSAINKLLDLMPMYKPDPDQDPPAYIQIFNLVQRERQEAGASKKDETPKEIKLKKGGGAKWLLIGGGIVVAGGLAAVALKNNNNSVTVVDPLPPLPTPPPLP